MATKLPDNELIGRELSSSTDTDAHVPSVEIGPARPRHADAAKARPHPSTSETIPQIEAHPELLDDPQAAQTDAAAPSQAIEAPRGQIAPGPAINAASSERAEIARRIAAFRKLQIKLKQDRESYFDETMAQTRELLSRRAKP